jgi:hypothetical protein
MQFSGLYPQLVSQFKPAAHKTVFAGTGITCEAFPFDSAYAFDFPGGSIPPGPAGNVLFAVPDEAIPENKSFTYYVFAPEGTAKFKKAILLLHGLNERSWDKYLAWAFYLARHTGHPVLLFPIAFHMNRSPQAWGDPRLMQPLQAMRGKQFGHDAGSTFANVALSERLSAAPLRFFTSGQQSAADCVKLCSQIHLGKHPLFGTGAGVNVFAYSIGAFLAQILFLANTGGLFANSRLFLFCGGAYFNEMNGVSRLIMDKPAFERLLAFYIHEISSAQNGNLPLAETMKQTETGKAFISMLAKELLLTWRDERFDRIQANIKALTLKNDNVIPAAQIMNALGPRTDAEMLDFPYACTHEAPFPLNKHLVLPQVDEAFEHVFSTAATFLS